MEAVGIEEQRMKPLFDTKPDNRLKLVEPPKDTITLTVTVVEDDNTTHTLTVKAEDLTKHFAYWQRGNEHALIHKRSGLVTVVLKESDKVKELAEKMEEFKCWDFTNKEEWEKWKEEIVLCQKKS